MNLLFLDVSTKTGWAAYFNDDTCPPYTEAGKAIFEAKRGESSGIRFLNFRVWLNRIVDIVRPAIIGYEQAHHRGGAATELCVGFITRVQEVAAHRGIEYVPLHSATLKKYITGSGRGDKSQVMEAVKKLYPDIKEAHKDDDIADALAGLTWLKNEFLQSAKKQKG